MARRIVLDPLTRIEGHLKVEVTIDGDRVVDAAVCGTMARGFEQLLIGRDPRDATVITERICGVCFAAHGWTSSMAVETAHGTAAVAPAARLIRNLIVSCAWLHDHLLHFYLLSLPDFIDLSSLAAYRGNDPVVAKVRDLSRANGQRGSIFSSNYPPDRYSLRDPEGVATLVNHYFRAVQLQMRAKKMAALLGGKQPHQSTIIAGGVTDMPTAESLTAFGDLLKEQKEFIASTYVSDVWNLATGILADLGKSDFGVGVDNYLAMGGFPETEGGFLYPEGVQVQGNLVATTRKSLEATITEDVSKSWYPPDSGGHPRMRRRGAFDFNNASAYTFIKAPRYDGKPMEVGPLARMTVAAARPDHPVHGHKAVAQFSQLRAQGYRPGSVMRHVARALETLILVDAMERWSADLAQLVPATQNPFLAPQIHDAEHWNPPESGQGVGLSEAPRGSLGHWIEIANRRIVHYACIAPTTWNASPSDAAGTRGPLEQALLNCPAADGENPIAIARLVRSFDPCIACAVHATALHSGGQRVVYTV
jgi:hydrogenase large subunit